MPALQPPEKPEIAAGLDHSTPVEGRPQILDGAVVRSVVDDEDAVRGA